MWPLLPSSPTALAVDADGTRVWGTCDGCVAWWAADSVRRARLSTDRIEVLDLRCGVVVAVDRAGRVLWWPWPDPPRLAGRSGRAAGYATAIDGSGHKAVVFGHMRARGQARGWVELWCDGELQRRTVLAGGQRPWVVWSGELGVWWLGVDGGLERWTDAGCGWERVRVAVPGRPLALCADGRGLFARDNTLVYRGVEGECRVVDGVEYPDLAGVLADGRVWARGGDDHVTVHDTSGLAARTPLSATRSQVFVDPVRQHLVGRHGGGWIDGPIAEPLVPDRVCSPAVSAGAWLGADGELVVVTEGRPAEVWRAGTRLVGLDVGWPRVARFSVDGRWLAVGGDAGTVVLDVAETAVRYRGAGAEQLRWSPSGRLWVSQGDTARFVDVSTGAEQAVLPPPDRDDNLWDAHSWAIVDVMGFSDDGRVLGAGVSGEPVWLGADGRSERVRLPSSLGDRPTLHAVSPRGRWAAVWGDRAELVLVELSAGCVLGLLTARWPSFSADDRRLAWVDEAGTLRVVELAPGLAEVWRVDLSAELWMPLDGVLPPHLVTLDPTGGLAAVWLADGTALVCARGQVLHRVDGTGARQGLGWGRPGG